MSVAERLLISSFEEDGIPFEGADSIRREELLRGYIIKLAMNEERAVIIDQMIRASCCIEAGPPDDVSERMPESEDLYWTYAECGRQEAERRARNRSRSCVDVNRTDDLSPGNSTLQSSGQRQEQKKLVDSKVTQKGARVP